MPLSHRERVQMALDHRQPDRVPLDLGGTQTSIHTLAYRALKRALGIATPTETQNIVLGLARLEPEVLERFDIDFLHILPGMPDTWTFQLNADDSFHDEWGTRWRRPPGGYYYDMVEFPLAGAALDDLASFAWPDPWNKGRLAGAAKQAERLYSETEYALEAGLVGLWETAWFLVGLERWMLRLHDDPDFVVALLDRVLENLKAMHAAYLAEVGPWLELVTLWDDYGSQNGPLIAPSMWRRLVKPRLAELIAALKSKTEARIAIHSCGSLWDILDDLIEVGVEVINPVQVTARNMDPRQLKQRYGKRLTFWGGIDTHHILPYGRPQDVSRAVREALQTLAIHGGYILASVHNIQPGVPPENIIAMFDTARKADAYPMTAAGA
ncbi:MAG TPA: uroporphyrinogen decarboxylase family protein [Anaerolineales bacterium]|nr:uroporphyrinogen decarboxylase family protein [Anaerolineales bacterium]